MTTKPSERVAQDINDLLRFHDDENFVNDTAADIIQLVRRLEKLLADGITLAENRISWHPVQTEPPYGCSNYKTRPCNWCVWTELAQRALQGEEE